jgi:hypothetical protein
MNQYLKRHTLRYAVKKVAGFAESKKEEERRITFPGQNLLDP